jgi:hypothetical protein
MHPRKQGNGVSPEKRAGFHRVSRRNEKKSAVKGPTTTAERKRKSRAVRDGVKKKAKAADTDEKHDFESFIDSEDRIEPRRFDKDTIKYSRRPAPSSPESKSPGIENHNDEQLSSQIGLFMKFPQDMELPSESELEEKFTLFGALDSLGTKIDEYSASAQVTFLHRSDAQSALKHAKQSPLFGHSNVSYQLCHTLPDSALVETKVSSDSDEDKQI